MKMLCGKLFYAALTP
ncbi:hypothetical protein M2G91_20805 [Vibrio vulnificus]|nr:hypothetical protein [Vibrio vulnificus]